MAIKYENSEIGSCEKGTVNNVNPQDTKKDTSCWKTCPVQSFVTGGIVILIMCTVLFVTILLLKKQSIPEDDPFDALTDNYDNQTTIPYPIETNTSFHIISRMEWVAQPPSEPLAPLGLPVPYVIIMHTAQEYCSDQASCTFYVRAAQNFHMNSMKWIDIGYSFLVGGDGNAYEGRGWKNVGTQVYGYNSKCIGIAFIGTFNTIMPPERQITAAKKLIESGVKEGYIAKDYKLLSARQLQTTQSPGLLLYEDVKTWPHWSPTP